MSGHVKQKSGLTVKITGLQKILGTAKDPSQTDKILQGLKMPGPIKRKSLTLKQRIDLINEVENSPGKPKRVIAEAFNIPSSTLCTVLKNREKYKSLYFSSHISSQAKRVRQCNNKDVDQALLEWFTTAKAANVPVNGTHLLQKATEISKKLGRPEWRCSDGWLYRFKKRHEIAFRAPKVEEKSVDEDITEAWIEQVLKPSIAAYSPKDVFNVDESGLFWKLLPDNTSDFVSEKCFAGNMSKQRLTFLVCANMDGSEKLPLYTIGRFENPRCFESIISPPVNYVANPKAWMTSELFTNWLIEFDDTMRSQQRQVLLVLDNSSAHEKLQHQLNATELLFLPPNAPSKLQPVDQGIIRNVKLHYRTMMLEKLFAHMDSGIPSKDFQINILDALIMLKQAWDLVTKKTIANSFQRANFAPLALTESANLFDDAASEDEMPVSIQSRVSHEWSIDAEDYVNIDEDLQTSDCSLIRGFTPGQASGSTATDSDSEEEEYDTPAPVSRKVLLDSLEQISLYCLQACSPDDEVSKSFSAFKETLRKHLIKSETTSSEFFTEGSKMQPDEYEGYTVQEVKQRQPDEYEGYTVQEMKQER